MEGKGMNHIVKIEHIPDSQDMFIKIPEDILEKLDWKEGDKIDCLKDNNSWILKKI